MTGQESTTALHQLSTTRDVLAKELARIDQVLAELSSSRTAPQAVIPEQGVQVEYAEMIRQIPGARHQRPGRADVLSKARLDMNLGPHLRGIEHWVIVRGIPDLSRAPESTSLILYAFSRMGFVYSFDLHDHDRGYYEGGHWRDLLAAMPHRERIDACNFRRHTPQDFDMGGISPEKACYTLRHYAPELFRYIQNLGSQHTVDATDLPCTRDDNNLLREYQVRLDAAYQQFFERLQSE